MTTESKKPISLVEAARVLAERYPEWAFDRQQLRHMCITRKIPYMALPMSSLKKTCSFRVRMTDLVKTFSAWEKKALDY